MTESERDYLLRKEQVCGLDKEERYRLTFEPVEVEE